MESISYLTLLTSLVLIGMGIFLILRLVRIMFRRIRMSGAGQKPQDQVLVDVLRSKVETAREAQNRLSQSRQAYTSLAHLYQTVTEHVPLGLLVLDEGLNVQFANPRAREILGLRDSAERGIVLPDSVREEVLRLQKMEPRESRDVEVFLNRNWLTLKLALIPLPEMAELLTVEDKTDMKRLEQSLQANREMTLMGEMASGVAHEVKNVLAIVEGRAQLMAITGDIETHRDIILAETRRLLSMVKRFMEFSKNQVVESERFSLKEWFAGLRQDWSTRGQEGRVEFHYACPDEAVFEGDPGMLNVLTDNLVRNGLEACAEADHESPLVTVRLEQMSQHLVLAVTDRGPGFSDDILKKVFLPFVTSKGEGSGLGLFHSRKIVLAHRGQMEIKLDPTRIRCIFPLAGVSCGRPSDDRSQDDRLKKEGTSAAGLDPSGTDLM